MSKILITERDIKWMREINRFGYVDAFYLNEKFQVRLDSIYRRLRKLIRVGLVKHEFINRDKPGVYYLTNDGIQSCGDVLPTITNVSQATFNHQLTVLRVCTALEKKYQAQFISERELRHHNEKSGVGVRGHVSDGMFLTGGKKAALEVELTFKSNARLRKIIQDYRFQSEFDEVWYVCGHKRLQAKVTKLTQGDEEFNVWLLNDLLGAVYE